MLHDAYNDGVYAACAAAGLVKEAGVASEVAKALKQTLTKPFKESFRGLREAAKRYKTVKKELAGKGISPFAVGVENPELQMARKELLSRAAPYLTAAGGAGLAGGLGTGGYYGAKALWPQAFED